MKFHKKTHKGSGRYTVFSRKGSMWQELNKRWEKEE